MKKIPAKKTETSKTRAKVRPVASKPTVNVNVKKTCANPWSLSIYVYWFIILFFIAATFYILGRSHNEAPNTNEVQITEEVLMQAADYYEKGREKLVAGNIDEAILKLLKNVKAPSLRSAKGSVYSSLRMSSLCLF